MVKSVENILPASTRTSAGLRNALFDELDALRSGTSNAQKANAVAKLADQIIATVNMELQVAKHVRALPPGTEEAAHLPAPIDLHG